MFKNLKYCHLSPVSDLTWSTLVVQMELMKSLFSLTSSSVTSSWIPVIMLYQDNSGTQHNKSESLRY